MSPDLRLEEDSIEEGLEKAEQLLEDLGLEEDFWIKPYTDFDGPVKTRETGEDEFHDGVDRAFQELLDEEDILNPGIISGRGLGYLLGQIDRMGLQELDVAGEMGGMYFRQDQLEGDTPDPRYASRVVSDEEQDKEQIYRFNQVLFDHLADHDLQLMYGDNMSNVVGSACIEAYGINLPEDRFSVEDTVYPEFYDNPTSQDVQSDIEVLYEQNVEAYSGQDEQLSDHFDFHGDLIRFDRSPEAVKVLTDALALNPFLPWGFQGEGDHMTMYPKYHADPDFSREDFEDFVSSVVQDYNREAEEELWASTYSDFSFDYGTKGYENMKSRAAQQMIDESRISSQVVATNTGDKPTDILEMENSIFFAQEGTEAERYCEDNDVPYVPVENAAESFAIQKELASRRQPPDV